MMNMPGLKRFAAFCTMGLLVLCSSVASLAQNIQLAPDSPDSYTVQDGDTLWDIAATFLAEPFRWPEIWQANPAVDDPDLIYPGDVLSLIYVDGAPRIVLERGSRTTVRLSPQVREIPLLSPIPAIPRQALAGFLAVNRIVDKEEFETAPYILASTTGNLIMGAGHEVYVRGDWTAASLSSFEIFRLGPTYIHGDTREPIGQEVINIGEVSIVSDEGNGIRKAMIVGSKEELKVGDRLLPREAATIDQSFFPTVPEIAVSGRVIGLLNKESQAAQFETVVLDLGEQDGLQAGDVLAIFESAEAVRDPVTGERVQLPETEIGLLMAYRTFDRLSYGVILSLTEPSMVGNTVRAP